jgi:uncharacterized protein YcbK (DUF882 family)
MERERRRQLIGLCAVVAAAAGLSAPTAAPAQQTVLIRIERPVFGQSGLLRARGGDRGIDRQAAQQLRSLMRDRITGRSVAPSVELVRLLAVFAEEFPGRTISIVHGYADPQNGSSAASHAEGRALDLRITDVDCSDIERFLVERPRLLARVGCFPKATFFHVDVGRSRGIWFDATVGLD